MTVPNKTFCILPWISLEASPIGTVRPCCLADDELVDDTGEKFSLLTANLDDIQNSASMRHLREQFLKGKKPQTCRKCWNEERAGRTSKRMHSLDRLKHILGEQTWTTHAKPLLFLDLKLGNICNLKCRICGSWSSSQFAAEELQFTPKQEQKQTYAYQMLRAGAWPKENLSFWQQIDHHLNNIRYIEFTGGEPFMIEQHFDMLQGMVDRGIASQVEIHYNTNGTHYPEKAEAIWQHFKTVEIAFSIDDLGQRFEYQRSNAVWSEVMTNLDRFRALRSRHKNIQLQVCSTVNIFNVWHLDELAEWIDRQDFNFIYWNILHEARYFSIASLPKKAKELVACRLDSAKVKSFHRQEFNLIRDFMMAGESMSAEDICHHIRRLDLRRGQNLREVIWELAESLEYDTE